MRRRLLLEPLKNKDDENSRRIKKHGKGEVR